jgi:hypothetical protein
VLYHFEKLRLCWLWICEKNRGAEYSCARYGSIHYISFQFRYTLLKTPTSPALRLKIITLPQTKLTLRSTKDSGNNAEDTWKSGWKRQSRNDAPICTEMFGIIKNSQLSDDDGTGLVGCRVGHFFIHSLFFVVFHTLTLTFLVSVS